MDNVMYQQAAVSAKTKKETKTEKISVARFLEECVMVVESREWSYEDGMACCVLNVSVEW